MERSDNTGGSVYCLIDRINFLTVPGTEVAVPSVTTNQGDDGSPVGDYSSFGAND
jgi:hypothetical protein